MAWSNSVAYGAAASGPVVHVSPAAMQGSGEGDAGVLSLATAHGRVTAAVNADPTLRDGVVSMTHGHADANPGDLTSGNVGVDPLTAMPRVAGLEVDVTRLDPAPADFS